MSHVSRVEKVVLPMSKDQVEACARRILMREIDHTFIEIPVTGKIGEAELAQQIHQIEEFSDSLLTLLSASKTNHYQPIVVGADLADHQTHELVTVLFSRAIVVVGQTYEQYVSTYNGASKLKVE